MSGPTGWTNGFIAVDWGTTNRRAYRVAGDGRCDDEFEDGKGILSVPPGGFPDAVAEIRTKLGDLPLMMAGMIGSNRGWKEAPYVRAPAGLDDLVKGLVWVSKREAIVPGVSYAEDDRADVMRGEEVQLMGAVADGLADPNELVCHPGTHNKWVLLRHGKIHGFRSVMTGELFSLLKEHSILSDLLGGPVVTGDAFCAGVRKSLAQEALTADLFAVRARVLLGMMKKEDAASFASGILIGADVHIGLDTPTMAQITVIGRPDLTRLYAAAIRVAERDAIEVDGERCFIAGTKEIVKRIS